MSDRDPRHDYEVIARRKRPKRLEGVLGQEHVTQTLANAIASGRIAHTFLFSGPRGVGKTSTARILAKALCCTAGEAPTPTPCGRCPPCVEIEQGTSTDVIELDAASNTQVDRVREMIIESLRYRPAGRYKVYIIDEVHMLSTASFNALLKTFEEPPDHVKFVLATTELHKVPITIRSRCQRYDFRLVATATIREHLHAILDEDRVEHDPTALGLVARLADGSVRDGQSLLEQVLAYAGGARVDGELVREALGAVEPVLVEQTFDGLLGRDPELVIRAVADVHARGLAFGRFTASLVDHARDLVVARAMRNPQEILHRTEAEVARLVERAAPHRIEALERLFEQLCRIQDEVARSAQARYALEVGLASLSVEPPQVSTDALLAQLDRLERRLSGPGGGGPGPGAAGRRVPPAEDGSARRRGGPTAEAVSASSSGPGPRRPGASDRGGRPSGSSNPGGPDPAAGSPDVETRFRAFVGLVARKRPAIAGPLNQVRPARFAPEGVVLACDKDFDYDTLTRPDVKRDLGVQASAFFGAPVAFEVVRAGAMASEAPRSLVEVEEDARARRIAEREKRAREHPKVRAVEQELGATIARVEVAEGEPGSPADARAPAARTTRDEETGT